MKTQLFLWCALAATLTSCTPEERGDSSNFPIDTYPIVFSAATCEFGQSTDNTGTKWTGGETFMVQVDGVAKKYILTNAAKGTLEAGESVTPFYWKGTNDITVNAWYPCDANNENEKPQVVVKADQSTVDNLMASDFIEAVDSKVSISLSESPLTFQHRVAKVVVNLKVDETLGISNLGIKLLNLVSLDQGNVITPLKNDDNYSAFVAPQNMTNKEFVDVIAGMDYSSKYIPKKENEGNLLAGKQYTYNIRVGAAGIDVIVIVDDIKWGADDEVEITPTTI